MVVLVLVLLQHIRVIHLQIHSLLKHDLHSQFLVQKILTLQGQQYSNVV
jgi:hypothetical protein